MDGRLLLHQGIRTSYLSTFLPTYARHLSIDTADMGRQMKCKARPVTHSLSPLQHLLIFKRLTFISTAGPVVLTVSTIAELLEHVLINLEMRQLFVLQ
jgi:hypothetical protein